MQNQLAVVGGILVIVALTFGGIFLLRPAEGNDYSAKTNREIALTCTTHAGVGYHVHPILKIFVNGEEQDIPADIGIDPTCMRSLHTHTADGVIHIESPEPRDFTLADFFAVWQKDFSSTTLMDNEADATHAITVTLNGEPVDTFENTVMRDADRIELRYGPTGS